MANPLTLGHAPPDGRQDEHCPVLPPTEFARIWLVEVPKVVARHQEERLHVRRELGLSL